MWKALLGTGGSVRMGTAAPMPIALKDQQETTGPQASTSMFHCTMCLVPEGGDRRLSWWGQQKWTGESILGESRNLKISEHPSKGRVCAKATGARGSPHAWGKRVWGEQWWESEKYKAIDKNRRDRHRIKIYLGKEAVSSLPALAHPGTPFSGSSYGLLWWGAQSFLPVFLP